LSYLLENALTITNVRNSEGFPYPGNIYKVGGLGWFLSVLELSSDAFCDAAAQQADDEDNADNAKHERRQVILCRRSRNDCHVLSDRLDWLSLTPADWMPKLASMQT